MLLTKTRAIVVALTTALAVTSFSATPASARHRGNAAAAAAFIGIVGTVAAIAAANARDRHYGPYGYYNGPVQYVPRGHWRHNHRHHHYRHWHR